MLVYAIELVLVFEDRLVFLLVGAYAHGFLAIFTDNPPHNAIEIIPAKPNRWLVHHNNPQLLSQCHGIIMPSRPSQRNPNPRLPHPRQGLEFLIILIFLIPNQRDHHNMVVRLPEIRMVGVDLDIPGYQ